MDASIEFEEKLRESACTGDIESIRKLLEIQNVNVNAQNRMNGWTALHWAAKRNQRTIVSYLLTKGANPNLPNKEGEYPANLSTDADVREMLGASDTTDVKQSKLPITPGYLANPPFPYTQPGYGGGGTSASPASTTTSESASRKLQPYILDENEIVLKIRLANSDERDFLEVELDRSSLCFESLLNLMCRELAVDRRSVNKVRKLPDTIVRKDKDVRRLRDFQELELVLTNRAISSSSRNYSGLQGTGLNNGVRNEQILY
ncbi:ankyrin repeat domain-containing protein 40-like [Mizuhopecten yessoensis]|uniref:Ankyrin repeat domain-containing protein 40 n=1 Tax=Mizuhopecten yessoensis TaxID=6573 RepID=A0A210QA90_MIZYE|nr:ankyrin repeat domain-containing protein 40-like [Mizuhopecten yessoensis]OWF45647.1 Ankyrin repeat domain-containing protein 40 [Mizuhopecten yessoensis]